MNDELELLEHLNAALRLGDPIIPLVGTLIEIPDRKVDPSVVRVFAYGGDARDGLQQPLDNISIGVRVERGGGVWAGLERWYHFPLPFTILELPSDPLPFDRWPRSVRAPVRFGMLLYEVKREP